MQTERLSRRELSRRKGLPGFEGDIYRGVDAIITDNAALIEQINDDVAKPREVLAGQPEFYGGLGTMQVQNCRTGRQWEWDGVHFELLAVEGEAADDNARSCVLRAVAGGTAFIVTGDLDIKGERKLLERYGQSLYSQALVLGHHGSSGSSSGAFLNAVSPDFAIASSGFGNSYRHPTAEVQNRVRAHGIRLLRTDRQGAWLLESDGQTVTARQWRPKRFYWQWKPLDD